ncbi:hypothetical protein FOL46_009886 [Perkinsus olseni]|uniref:PDZ domain-containing protein n=1 Tax=Perkinsus olseni TaxID=32597 RepID=A0A7J6MJL4_PEROL|nr:hypothetical protein FOL46_009886 [Perkinsus olseni]
MGQREGVELSSRAPRYLRELERVRIVIAAFLDFEASGLRLVCGSWRCIDARTGRVSGDAAAAYSGTDATVLGLPCRKYYQACVAAFMVPVGSEGKPAGWWTTFSDESAPVYLDLFIRRTEALKGRKKKKRSAWPTEPPWFSGSSHGFSSGGVAMGETKTVGEDQPQSASVGNRKFVCLVRDGVAFRSSPNIDDKCSEGVRGGQIVEAADVDDGWIRTRTDLWLPLRIDDQLLFEEVLRCDKVSPRPAPEEDPEEAFTVDSIVPGVTSPIRTIVQCLSKPGYQAGDPQVSHLKRLLHAHYMKMREMERKELEAVEAFEKASEERRREKERKKKKKKYDPSSPPSAVGGPLAPAKSVVTSKARSWGGGGEGQQLWMRLTEPPDRSSTGIGATFDWSHCDDRVRVQRVEFETASRRMGMRPGDILDSISDMPVDCTMQAHIILMLRSRRPLKLGITRPASRGGPGGEVNSLSTSDNPRPEGPSRVEGRESCGCSGLTYGPATNTLFLHRESTLDRWGFTWDDHLYSAYGCRVVKDVVSGSIAAASGVEAFSRLLACNGNTEPEAITAALTGEMDIQLTFVKNAGLTPFTLTVSEVEAGSMALVDGVVTLVKHGGTVCAYNRTASQQRKVEPGCHVISTSHRAGEITHVLVRPKNGSGDDDGATEPSGRSISPRLLENGPVESMPWRFEVSVFRRSLMHPWGFQVDPTSLKVTAIDEERVSRSGMREDDVVQSANGQAGASLLFNLSTATAARLVLVRRNAQVQIYTATISREPKQDFWGITLSPDRLVKKLSGPSLSAVPPLCVGDCLVSVNGSGSAMREIAAELRAAGPRTITVQLVRCVDGVAAEAIERRPRALSRPPPLLPPIPKMLPSSRVVGRHENLIELERADERANEDSQADVEKPAMRERMDEVGEVEDTTSPEQEELDSRVTDGGGADQPTVVEDDPRIVERELLRTGYARACQQGQDTIGPDITSRSAARELLLQLYSAAADRPVHITLARESTDIRWGLPLSNSGNAAAVVAGVVGGSPAWGSDEIREGDEVMAAKVNHGDAFDWNFEGVLRALMNSAAEGVDLVVIRSGPGKVPSLLLGSPTPVLVPVVVTRKAAEDPWGVSFEGSTGVVTGISNSGSSELMIGDRIVSVGEDDSAECLHALAATDSTVLGLKVIRSVSQDGLNVLV